MEARVSRKELFEKLGSIIDVVKTKNEHDYNCVSISVRSEKCTATVCNEHTTAIAKLPVVSTQNGDACLNAKKLYEILKAHDDETITIKAADENSVYVIADDSQYILPQKVTVEESLPEQPEVITAVNSKELLHALRIANDAADQNIGNLSCVFFEFGDSLNVYATNRVKVAKVAVKLTNDVEPKRVTIPLSASTSLEPMLSKIDGEVSLSFNDSSIIFSSGDYVFKVAQSAWKDIDFSSVLKVNAKVSRFTVDAEYMLSTLERAAIMDEQETNKVTFFLEKNKESRLEASSVDGRSTVEFLCDYNGPSIEFSLNSRQLKGFLKLIDGDIELKVAGNSGPVYITDNQSIEYVQACII